MDYADLHRLVDQVPRHSLHLVARLVEAVLSEEDPVARALDVAPEDDEPLTEEDRGRRATVGSGPLRRRLHPAGGGA